MICRLSYNIVMKELYNLFVVAEFLAAFGAVFTIVILIAIGFFLGHFGKINEEISKFITCLVLNVSLPCLMAFTILTSFDVIELNTIPKSIAVPLFSIIIVYIAGFNIVKITNPREGRFGQMVTQTAQNNTIFMGLPVNIATLGAYKN